MTFAHGGPAGWDPPWTDGMDPLFASTRFATPLGSMLAVATDFEIMRLDFVAGPWRPGGLMLHGSARLGPPRLERHRLLHALHDQLAEYFGGGRRAFDVPLFGAGTPFQQRVWEELLETPYGGTVTYGELARRAGAAKAARAAGQACGRNPILIAIPCHRAVRASGEPGKYKGGEERKRRLLNLEATGRADAAP